jgi:cation diffusion facilitator CzcD-associated flavoprotein CzcO
MLETPVERVTPAGIRTTAEEFELDMIVYATGFDAITGSFDRIDIRGAGGVALRDRWRGGPETCLGVLVRGFPNMLMAMGPHSAFGNIPRSIEFTVEWIADLTAHMETRGLTFVEARPEAVDEWMEWVRRKGEGLLSNEVDSWMTGVNMNVEGKQVRTLVRYAGTAPDYRARLAQAAAAGYPELAFA